MSDLHPPASTPAPSASAASPDPVDRSAEHGQLRMVATRFLRHRMAMASLTVLVLTVLFAFLGPLLWPWDHTVHREILPNQPPSWAHPFGTTNAGHDVLGQLMRGTQQTLKVALTVSVLATAFGALWGAVIGFVGHWATRGRRDFSSVRGLEAESYAVQVDAGYEDEAARAAGIA